MTTERVESKSRRRIARALLAGGLALGSVLGFAAPAQAYSSTVWGELNCTGSTVYFSTVRYTQGSAMIQYALANETGSTYGSDGIYLGVYIVAENSYKGLKYMSVPSYPNAVLSGTFWLKNTAFKMYGRMPVSDGACDNYFSGTLYF